MILLVTELEELSANPKAPTSGHVIESQLDPGRGPVVTVLVERGTLRVGDSLVAGPQWGRVRAMQDFTGTAVSEAVPGMPVGSPCASFSIRPARPSGILKLRSMPRSLRACVLKEASGPVRKSTG